MCVNCAEKHDDPYLFYTGIACTHHTIPTCQHDDALSTCDAREGTERLRETERGAVGGGGGDGGGGGGGGGSGSGGVGGGGLVVVVVVVVGCGWCWWWCWCWWWWVVVVGAGGW